MDRLCDHLHDIEINKSTNMAKHCNLAHNKDILKSVYTGDQENSDNDKRV